MVSPPTGRTRRRTSTPPELEPRKTGIKLEDDDDDTEQSWGVSTIRKEEEEDSSDIEVRRPPPYRTRQEQQRRRYRHHYDFQDRPDDETSTLLENTLRILQYLDRRRFPLGWWYRQREWHGRNRPGRLCPLEELSG